MTLHGYHDAKKRRIWPVIAFLSSFLAAHEGRAACRRSEQGPTPRADGFGDVGRPGDLGTGYDQDHVTTWRSDGTTEGRPLTTAARGCGATADDTVAGGRSLTPSTRPGRERGGSDGTRGASAGEGPARAVRQRLEPRTPPATACSSWVTASGEREFWETEARGPVPALAPYAQNPESGAASIRRVVRDGGLVFLASRTAAALGAANGTAPHPPTRELLGPAAPPPPPRSWRVRGFILLDGRALAHRRHRSRQAES